MEYKVGDTVRTLVNAVGTEKSESPVGSIGAVVSVKNFCGYQELLVNSESFPWYSDNKWYFANDEVELVEQ